jgi:hypothetical protein
LGANARNTKAILGFWISLDEPIDEIVLLALLVNRAELRVRQRVVEVMWANDRCAESENQLADSSPFWSS